MKKTTLAIIIGVALLLVVGAVFLLMPKPVSGSLESVSTGLLPWTPDATHLRERLAALNLPALTTEGQALHTHQHLDLYVHGQKVEVPTDIGIHEALPAFISSIHTHDTSGIIHVESPTVSTFTLGQFFDIWGLRLTGTCIGGYCTDATNTLKVYVNGAQYTGDPRTLELVNHDEIVITYGLPTEEPKVIPAAYSFPEGY